MTCRVCGGPCNTPFSFHIRCPRHKRRENNVHTDCLVAWFRSGHSHCPCHRSIPEPLSDESDFENNGLSLQDTTRAEIAALSYPRNSDALARLRKARELYLAATAKLREAPQTTTLYRLNKKRDRAERAVDRARTELRAAIRGLPRPHRTRVTFQVIAE